MDNKNLKILNESKKEKNIKKKDKKETKKECLKMKEFHFDILDNFVNIKN